MSQQESSNENFNPIWKILIIYFKASRKRVISMFAISLIFFLFLTSIVIISSNFYQDSFYSTFDRNHDWLNDNEISVYGVGSIKDPEILEAKYLMKEIDLVSTELENIIPNIQKQSAGVLEITLNNFRSINDYFSIILSVFDNTSQDLIINNLLSGRLPENTTEILYYNAINQPSYKIGDILNLTGREVYGNYPIITKCQIVGIVNNLESPFYKNNISSDILRETTNYFISTNSYYYDLVNDIDNKSNRLSISIDFEYTFKIKHFEINKYIRVLNDYYRENSTFGRLPESRITAFSFFDDLLHALNNFKMKWYLTIYNQLLICSPFILLIAFISVEIYRTSNHEKRAKYRLLKTHGLENNSIAKFLFLENIILIGTSLIIGLCSSLFIDYFIIQSLKLSPNISYITGFTNLSSILVILLSCLTFFTINFIMDLVQLKNTNITVMEQYRTKKRNFLSKIFSIPELNFLFPGSLLTIFGLLLSYLAYNGDYNIEINIYKYFIIFSLMAFLGILLLLFATFIFLRRVIIYFWYRVGCSLWGNTKNYFSLALKHLSIFIKKYKNTIMVFFLLGLCLTPGFVINKSINSHTTLEANLSVGCSNILVKNWDANENLKSNISRINGIELSTVLTHINFQREDSSVSDYSLYIYNLYVLTNITEFIEIVDFTLLTQDGYSKNDIIMLENDLTYLMNRKYAQKNDYDKNEIFSTVGMTPVVYQPKNLIYINDFSYFPLVSQKKFEGVFFEDIFNQPTYIDLVISSNTKNLILEHNIHDQYQEDYLLIKTSEWANITAIKKELSSKYNLSAYSLEDFIEIADNDLNSLGVKLFIIISIFSAMLTILYGCFKAANIYKERQRILEIFVRNGAKRWLIVGNFSVEIFLVLFLPLIVSLVIAIPYIYYSSSFLLNIITEYKAFIPWYPWWIFILIGLIALLSLLIGWYTSLYFFVKSYKFTKIE